MILDYWFSLKSTTIPQQLLDDTYLVCCRANRGLQPLAPNAYRPGASEYLWHRRAELRPASIDDLAIAAVAETPE